MSDYLDIFRKKEPGRSERATAWQTAMGLQAADGLSTSDFLWQTSQKHVNGKISIDQAEEKLNRYYIERNAQDAGDPEKEEADKVSVNIVRILLAGTLDFSVEGLISLHRKLFAGVYENTGAFRSLNVSKKEWVLGGDSFSYREAESIPGLLESSLASEKTYSYETSLLDTQISHLSAFISDLWSICAFGQGNTRFTAVFTVLYLRHLGIGFKYDTFANNAWYFHNALVRANFRNIVKRIDCEPIYLERFFRNLLLREQWDLRNRYLHIHPAAEWREQANQVSDASTGQVQDKNGARKDNVEYKLRESKDNEITPVLPESSSNAVPVNSEGSCLDNPNILFLAVVIGQRFLSVKEMMDGLHLKGRDNFLKLYLSPAVQTGIVALLYPRSPRHPRQKYLLTQKGFAYLNDVGPEMVERVERHLASLSD